MPRYKIKSPRRLGARDFGTIELISFDTFASEWGIAERGIFMAIHSSVNESFIFENTLLHYSHQKKKLISDKTVIDLRERKQNYDYKLQTIANIAPPKYE